MKWWYCIECVVLKINSSAHGTWWFIDFDVDMYVSSQRGRAGRFSDGFPKECFLVRAPASTLTSEHCFAGALLPPHRPPEPQFLPAMGAGNSKPEGPPGQHVFSPYVPNCLPASTLVASAQRIQPISESQEASTDMSIIVTRLSGSLPH